MHLSTTSIVVHRLLRGHLISGSGKTPCCNCPVRSPRYGMRSLPLVLFMTPSLDRVPRSSEKNEALTWYSCSMTTVRKLIEQNRANQEIAIVTWVVYICIEIMQGHMSEALRLYEQGVSLIYERRTASTTRASFLGDTIIPLFFRMGIAALSAAGVPVVNDLFALVDHRGDTGFFTVEAARAALALLTRESLLFRWEAGARILEVGSVANVSAEIFIHQQCLLSRLECWRRSFTGLASSKPGPIYESAISTLRTFHTAVYIILSICLTQHETVFDNHLSHFQSTVDDASQTLATRTTAVCPGTVHFRIRRGLTALLHSCQLP